MSSKKTTTTLFQFVITATSLEEANEYINETLRGLNGNGNIVSSAYIGTMVDSQIKVIKSEEKNKTFTFKLLLRTGGMDKKGLLNLEIAGLYNSLEKNNFIKGDIKDFKTIFQHDVRLCRTIWWIGNRNELKYLVCKLSGKEFKENPLSKGLRVTLEETNKTIFYDNTSILLKAANSFLSDEGKVIPSSGVSTPRAKTYLSRDSKNTLNDIASPLLERYFG